MGARVNSVYSAHSPTAEASRAPSVRLCTSTAVGPSAPPERARALRRMRARLNTAYTAAHASASTASRKPHSPAGVAWACRMESFA